MLNKPVIYNKKITSPKGEVTHCGSSEQSISLQVSVSGGLDLASQLKSGTVMNRLLTQSTVLVSVPKPQVTEQVPLGPAIQRHDPELHGLWLSGLVVGSHSESSTAPPSIDN